MDNKMMTFENAAFGKIRTLTIDGEPWFVWMQMSAPSFQSRVPATGFR